MRIDQRVDLRYYSGTPTRAGMKCGAFTTLSVRMEPRYLVSVPFGDEADNCRRPGPTD